MPVVYKNEGGWRSHELSQPLVCVTHEGPEAFYFIKVVIDCVI